MIMRHAAQQEGCLIEGRGQILLLNVETVLIAIQESERDTPLFVVIIISVFVLTFRCLVVQDSPSMHQALGLIPRTACTCTRMYTYTHTLAYKNTPV